MQRLVARHPPIAVAAAPVLGKEVTPHSLPVGLDSGSATAQPQAVPTPGTQLSEVVVTPAAPQLPSTGKDLEPPMPEAGRAEEDQEPPASEANHAEPSSIMVPTRVSMPLPRKVLVHGNHGALFRPGALDDAYAAHGWLRADLQDADRCLARELLGLASAWLQVERATKEAWSRSETVTAESKEEAANARAAHDDALAEAAATAKRCSKAEAILKALQEEQGTRMQQLQ